MSAPSNIMEWGGVELRSYNDLNVKPSCLASFVVSS